MIIFHIDVNSAFLSWTALRLLKEGYGEDIRNIPSAIAAGDEKSRHGIILAKSVPAKAYDIQTAQTIYKAKQNCPNIKLFPPDFATFNYYSDKMYELLLDYSPQVQRFSIDECFVDYTASQKIFGDPVEVAYKIKQRIWDELGFTVNIGVSQNKVLAKMASDFEKPDRVHTLFVEEIESKMWHLPIEELFMVGKATAKKLRSININTIGELANTEKSVITNLLKKQGEMVWEYANGIDKSPVLPNEDVSEKSIGNSITLAYDVENKEDAYRTLLWLSEKTVGRLRAQGYFASNISVNFKTSEFVTYSHQTKINGGISTVDEVYACARMLFDEGWKGEPLRLLGVTLSDLSTEVSEQLSLFSNTNNAGKPTFEKFVKEDRGEKQTAESLLSEIDREKSLALEKTLGEIRKKFGKKAVSIASIKDIEN